MRSEIEQLYQHDLELSRQWIAKLEKRKKPSKIFRTMDKYFKFILKDEVLRKAGPELFRIIFKEEDISSVFSAGNQIQIAYGRRSYDLDVVAHVMDSADGSDPDKASLLCLEMQRSKFWIERFFVYWGALAADRPKGTPTEDLEPRKSLLVVLSNVGQEADVFLNTEKWYHTWGMVPLDDDDAKIGTSSEKGMHILVIDLKKHKEQVPEPKTFLDFYLSFLTCETYEELNALLQKDRDGIMEDIIRKDAEFLGSTKMWKVYMKGTKTEIGIITERNARLKAEAEIKAKNAEIAKIKDEADKAKAEIKAKDAKMAEMQAEIDRLKAGQQA